MINLNMFCAWKPEIEPMRHYCSGDNSVSFHFSVHFDSFWHKVQFPDKTSALTCLQKINFMYNKYTMLGIT